ncbi:MAG: phosphodiester glycosidase family protein [Oscillospiraceae bacterium]|nr:phosphodiester glycosidase family protein [Oscillospiraceae bacterium]MDD4367563.1 phosphodiester glycosidase family protein [Oscillospiraceae bacterium]
MVVVDGRSSASQGVSLYQLAEFMQTLQVQTAYNLDGGGSATLYFNGQVINNPTSDGRVFKERKVSDILYVG